MVALKLRTKRNSRKEESARNSKLTVPLLRMLKMPKLKLLQNQNLNLIAEQWKMICHLNLALNDKIKGALTKIRHKDYSIKQRISGMKQIIWSWKRTKILKTVRLRAISVIKMNRLQRLNKCAIQLG